MLVAAGMVSEAQVKQALTAQRRLGMRLGETLVVLGHVTEGQMTQVVSNQLTIPWVNLYHVDFSRELLGLVPSEIAEKYRLIPVYVRHVRRQGDTLYVAMDDPLNMTALQEVADGSGLPVKPMVASPSDIQNAIRVYYLGLPPLEDEDVGTSLPGVAKPKPKPAAKASPAAPASSKPRPSAPKATASKASAPKTSAAETNTAEESAAEASAAETNAAEESAAEESAAEESAEPTEASAPVEAEPQDVEEVEEDERPAVRPSVPPGPRPGPGFMTLTLLDGTQVRLPSGGTKEKEKAEERLTTRDLIHALQAKASGADVSDVLPEDAWEPLFATLLSVLLRKGLIADWEFVDEWNKQRRKSE